MTNHVVDVERNEIIRQYCSVIKIIQTRPFNHWLLFHFNLHILHRQFELS